jgi:hypothetical protein
MQESAIQRFTYPRTIEAGRGFGHELIDQSVLEILKPR